MMDEGWMYGWMDAYIEYCFVIPPSDKQELLPEAEDQLSVESLSIPDIPKVNQA